MSDIKTLSVDLKAAALKAKSDADEWGYDTDAFHDVATPDAVIELVEVLEKAQRSNSSQNDYINQQQDRIDQLEKRNGEIGKALGSAEKRISGLKDENEYIRNRFKEVDRLFGKNLLVMQAAIIEWRATGDAKDGMAWIFNTLFGPGELPDEDEKDAQAYFDREYASIDKELMELHKWFYERHKRTEPA